MSAFGQNIQLSREDRKCENVVGKWESSSLTQHFPVQFLASIFRTKIWEIEICRSRKEGERVRSVFGCNPIQNLRPSKRKERIEIQAKPPFNAGFSSVQLECKRSKKSEHKKSGIIPPQFDLWKRIKTTTEGPLKTVDQCSQVLRSPNLSNS